MKKYDGNILHGDVYPTQNRCHAANSFMPYFYCIYYD
jgi:hypothetical protein